MTRLSFYAVLIASLCVSIAGSACMQTEATQEIAAQEDIWVGTWTTSVQLTEPRNLPPEPGIANNTLRQIVRPSIGGDRLQVHFSNVFGTESVTLQAVHFAVSQGEGAIDPSTDLALSFEGASNITILPGESATSDPFDFSLAPRTDVAITIHFGSVSNEIITGHPGSRTTSYIVEGAAVSVPEMEAAVTTDHWYIISGIDVVNPEGQAVITLGNSITDGRGSGTNQQNRWPDILAERLLANEGTENVSVLNAGIGGNCVLRDCLGPAAIDRFERDVLNQNGAKWLIILEGVNDIGGSSPEDSPEVAQNLINAYTELVARAHDRDILVYGATIMPFGESFYDSPEHEAARQTVNEWMRTSGVFDAVIDLDEATRNPEIPHMLLPAGDTGDHLHPNEAGHRMMGEAISLTLFER